MTLCMELVIYKIKTEGLNAFPKIHQEIQVGLKQLPGFVQFETAAGTKDPRTRVDRVIWQNQAFAEAAYKAFSAFPQAKEFMALVEEVRLSEHFLLDT